MPELTDLSGPFDPNVRFEDFSKDFLLKIMKVWQYAWLTLSEDWYDAVVEQCGQEKANLCERAAWLNMGAKVNPRYAKIANIPLNTVLDSVKAMCLPLDNTLGGLFPVEYDIRDENHVIMTVRDCQGLRYWEKTAPERIPWVCSDHWCMEQIRNYLINRNIRVTALKLPPRKNRDEIACQFELTLE